MKNILVTVDFDKSRKLILETALEQAKAFGAKLWLLHVFSPLIEFDELKTGRQDIRDLHADEMRSEHKELQEYASRLKSEGIDAEGLYIPGETTESIIDKSKELNIDLIIAGYHDHGFFYNAFIGSVSSEIIKNSHIPVMVVPLD